MARGPCAALTAPPRCKLTHWLRLPSMADHPGSFLKEALRVWSSHGSMASKTAAQCCMAAASGSDPGSFLNRAANPNE